MRHHIRQLAFGPSAFVSGYGSLELLVAEFTRFGLSEAGGKRLRELATAALTRRLR